MNPIFLAMARPLPLWIFKLLICFGTLIFIFRTLWLAFTRRSARRAIIALLVSLVFGLVFTPWTTFRAFDTGNPDVLFWQPVYRIMAYSWFGAFGLSLLAMLFVLEAGVQLGSSLVGWIIRALKVGTTPRQATTLSPSD